MRHVAIIAGLIALAAGIASAQGIQISSTPAPPPEGFVGTPYTLTLIASEPGYAGTFTWSQQELPSIVKAHAAGNVGSLPPGLNLSSTGIISGTPTTVGPYSFGVVVFDSQNNEAVGNFTINIAPCAPTVQTTSPFPGGEIGIFYTQTIVITGCSGSTYSFAPVTLPPGLTLDISGNLTGTPTKAGTYSIQVFITDQTSGMVAAQPTFSLTIVAPPAFSTTSPLNGGIVGLAYSQKIVLTGGVKPYTFGVSGSVPGLLFDTSGLLRGTPTTAGAYTITVTATDALGVQVAPTTFSITIATATSMLQVSPTSLTFNSIAGGSAPVSQAISVIPTAAATNAAFTIALDGGQTNTPAPSWLSVVPTKGTAPAQVIVSADQGSLQAGSNLGRVAVLDSNGLPSYVSVTLNVVAGTAQITVAPAMLRFAARQQAPGTLIQDLAITSSGGGGSLGFTTSVLGGSSWIQSVTPSSGQTTRNTPTLLQVQVNTQGLQVGSYHDMIQVSSSAGNTNVPVELFVSSGGSILGVSVTGLHFPERQGAGAASPQSIKVLNLGDPTTTVNWSASLLSGSNWLTLAPASGTATLTTPGVLTLIPNQASGSLPAGSQYALIQITDPHSQISPQYVVAVLDIEPSSGPPLPNPAPGGLFFTAVAGGAATSGQTINVQTSSSTNVAFQAAASTTDGGTWLSVNSASGNASTQSAGALTVTVNPSKLTAGIYTGGVSISMSGVVSTVNITAVILPGTATSSSLRSDAVEPAAAANCTPAKVALTETGLVNNFSVPAGWPANLIVQLNDDCGNSVTNGSTIASFSNGDAPVTLRGDSLGNYSATWQPGTTASQMVITLNAASGSLAPATAKLVGGITQNSAPVLAPGGTLNNLNPVVGAALAPGTVSQVYGTGLSTFTGNPGILPLPNSYPATGSTFMLAGGLRAPFYYLSNGQLNVELPSELTPNQQYAVVVSSNNALTLPDTIDVVPAQPGVAATGDGHVIAQHNANFGLISSSSPAVPGEYIIVYLVGMGATNPSVPTGAAAPTTSPYAPVTVQPTITVGGQAVNNIAYAGLTPGAAGLYQITFQVPSNLPAGDLSLVITQGGVSANTTLLTVQ